jgi:hypothetical protein
MSANAVSSASASRPLCAQLRRRTRIAVLVFPVRRYAALGDRFHVLGADLQLDTTLPG